MFAIKEKYKKSVVGYNGSTTPLGERNDLLELADIAVRSQDPSLLILFKKQPTAEEVQTEREKEFFKNESNGDTSTEHI